MHPLRSSCVTNFIARHGRGRRLAMLASLPIAVTAAGCSFLLPYKHAVVVDPDAKAPPGLELAGGAESALRTTEDLRHDYYARLQTSFAARSASATLAIGLSGWALYNALKPELTTGDTRRSIRLGAGLAGLYALREAFVNDKHEQAFADTYRELTCVMYQASPLLMTEGVPGSTANGEVEVLDKNMKELTAKIETVHKLVALYDSELDRVAGSGDDAKAAETFFRAQSSAAKTALQYARNAWRDGSLLRQAVMRSGETIRAETAFVVGNGNLAIQEGQNKFADAETLVKGSKTIASSVKSIGAQTEADQADMTDMTDMTDTSGGAKTSDAGGARAEWRTVLGVPDGRSSLTLIRVATTAAELAPVGTAAKDVPAATAALKPAGPKTAEPFPDASTAAKTPKPARKPATKWTAKAPQAASPATGSLDDLKAMQEKLAAVIKKVEADIEAKRRKDAADKLAKDRSDFQKDIYGVARGKLTCKASPPSAWPEEPCTENLAWQVEELYALRRPVSQTVLGFRSRAREVAESAVCAEFAALRVTPDRSRTARPGDTLEFLVSQRRGDENPIAVLQGPMDGETGATLTPVALAGTKRTKLVLKLGPKMAPQDITLVVADAQLRATETIVVRVRKPKAAVDDKRDTKAAVSATKPATST